MFEELNHKSLETSALAWLHNSLTVAISIISLEMFYDGQSISENHETLPPETIHNIQWYIIGPFLCSSVLDG